MENMQLAQRIRAFRKLKGLTQQQLAAQIEVSLAVLGAVERGNRRADEALLSRIADALGISLDELTLRG
ncbi:helix-turn-helix transcriptional regulator [Paenibacillus sp. F411]|uniref:Helix-turn-helix domain protein n=1 Tax=Paenibacillus algicola TaxID=2565926 RepID=A0A4P8XFF1_9BACL|nr:MULTISPECIES: helix-turn-helix transcriptional regulator [Paenibacillus]MBO2945976.1 helix-turn-helix transcriptional regulator [Paenibacillus sp. F411]QCT00803.1 helix-turn-helix domain protein [Paenibacillus algicola]